MSIINQQNTAQAETVVGIPINKLKNFADHPFSVKDDEAMQQTVESIREYGVLVPAIARPLDDGTYELIKTVNDIPQKDSYTFTSPALTNGNAYRYIRYRVTATGSGDTGGGIVGKAYYTKSGKEMNIINCVNNGDIINVEIDGNDVIIDKESIEV